MRWIGILLSLVLLLAGCAKKEPELDIWTAAATGDTREIKLLLALGENPNLKEPINNSSPLIMAAIFGQTKAAKLLVESGADLNASNNDKTTALHSAAFFCHMDTVEYLLEAGASTDARNRFGHTPLESVSREWDASLERTYKMYANLLSMEMDLEYIQTMRPRIADLMREHIN